MVSPDNFPILKRNMLLWLGVNMQNRMRHVDGEVGNDAASNIDAVVLFVPTRWGNTVKIDDTVKLLPIGKALPPVKEMTCRCFW